MKTKMDLPNLLHKLGITRDKEYTQKDYPIQTATDKVQDVEKGFVDKEFTRQDITVHDPSKEKKGKVLFWIMTMAGFLMLITVFSARNFSIWFVVLLSLWSAYLFNIRHSISIGTFIFSKMIVFGIIVFLLSAMIISTVLPD